MMPGMESKRNYDPSRASVGPDTGAAGHDGRDALQDCVDGAGWNAGAARAAPDCCTRRCNSGARGRNASKERTLPCNPREDKTVATVPSHAPPCVSQAGLDNGAVSCQLRPVCSGLTFFTKGDDIGASTVGAVGALSCNRLLSTIQRPDDRTDPAPSALMMSPPA